MSFKSTVLDRTSDPISTIYDLDGLALGNTPTQVFTFTADRACFLKVEISAQLDAAIPITCNFKTIPNQTGFSSFLSAGPTSGILPPKTWMFAIELGVTYEFVMYLPIPNHQITSGCLVTTFF
jgi:hypothetical protein